MDKEAATVNNTMMSVGTQLSLPPLPARDGAELNLQTLRGKKVLLFMWGSW